MEEEESRNLKIVADQNKAKNRGTVGKDQPEGL
jgi:hypothetical protein